MKLKVTFTLVAKNRQVSASAADLRGLSVHERAEALISISAPEVRLGLAAHWDDIRKC